MSDAWEEIQAIKSKRNTLREKIEKRKKEREGILNLELSGSYQDGSASKPKPLQVFKETKNCSPVPKDESSLSEKEEIKRDREVEVTLLQHLCDVTLVLPVTSSVLSKDISKTLNNEISEQLVINFLQKFATQQLISIKDCSKDSGLEVYNSDHAKLLAMVNDLGDKNKRKNEFEDGLASKKTAESKKEVLEGLEEMTPPDGKELDTTDIMSLLSMPTIKEKESKKVGEEIMELLSKPTAKERSLAERFRSQGGATVMQFCPHGTKAECQKAGQDSCQKLHFKKIIQGHTDESLGDCSFLNTCFHMDTCKYVHYEVDAPKGGGKDIGRGVDVPRSAPHTGTVLYPPQWIQCDLRYLDMSVLGKFAVVMADPPWDIHMELPYGTLSDDEMRQLGVPQLQDDGLIFLWVTGRAMELGRECLKLWGYDRVDELIWVKTNQLQRIIRTGRTGHWLNHGKEHCLVGLKGNPPNLNRGLDCDVIVAEVRATSHKPDEIYGIIERLSPGTRKIELFGRPHNVQPNWITLGNQVDGVRLVDPELIAAFRKAYPDGNCMLPPAKP